MSNIQEIKTACRACHGGCGTIVTVEDGVVTKIRPDPDSPISKGRMCPKGLAGKELLYHPKRLNYPMKRVGERGEGKWERITWDEALDTIVANIKHTRDTYSMHSVLIVQGTGRHHFGPTARFASILGTANWMEPGQAQCFQPRVNNGTITYGSLPMVDYYGDTMPDCILVWGHNPLISSGDGEMGYCVNDSLREGSQLIVVDPRPTELAKKAKVWLRLRPGTDGALALAMLHVIINEELYDKEFVEKWTHGFEELRERVQKYTPAYAAEITWVEEEKIIEAARLYAAAQRGVLEWGCALDQTPNSFDNVRAISFLPGICGHFEIPGGMILGSSFMPRLPAGDMTPQEELVPHRLGAKDHPMLGGIEMMIPSAHVPSAFRAIETGDPYPIDTMLLFGNNGLVGFGDATKAHDILKTPRFTCATDLFMTPTAELCDMVLPAACWLELDSLYAVPFGAPQVAMAQRKIVRLHERMPDEEIYCEICKRLGIDYGADSFRELLDKQCAEFEKTYPKYGHIKNFEDMCEQAYFVAPREYHRHEKNGFDTPTGKMEIWSTILEKYGIDPIPDYIEPPESPYSTPELLEDYPLVFTTGGRSRFYFLSEGRHLRSCRKGHPFPCIEMSPETGATYGIEDGDWVWIESPRGRITQKAKFMEGLDPRVVNVQHGWWFPEADGTEYGWRECNANILTSAAPPYNRAIGTYQLRGLLCRISKNDDRSIEERYAQSEMFK